MEFHKLVASDISRIMDYYESVAGPELADDFFTELQFYFQKAADSPESYGVRERDLRRVNLNRFPYHFLFAWLKTAREYWLFVITKDGHR